MVYGFWMFLALSNFVIQILYFRNDGSKGLFIAKKISTPLLLFYACAVSAVQGSGLVLIPAGILGMMGLGELGIEGSAVVEDRKGKPSGPGNIWVTLAGILFLLVNVLLGVFLFLRAYGVVPAASAVWVADSILLHANPTEKLSGIGSLLTLLAIPALLVGLPLYLTIRLGRPRADVRFQMLVYGAGLFLLAAGVLADLFAGSSRLGFPAAILTISDTLVLIRMGVGWDRNQNGQSRILFAFLVVILLLYYAFIWLMMGL